MFEKYTMYYNPKSMTHRTSPSKFVKIVLCEGRF